MEKSIFGSMFDLNRDGKLDTFEKTEELIFLYDIFMGDSEEETGKIDPDLDELYGDDLDDADIDFDGFD